MSNAQSTMHKSPQHQVQDQDQEHPPPYSSPTTTTTSPQSRSQPQIPIPGLPNLDYTKYSIPDSKTTTTTTPTGTEITTRNTTLNTDPAALANFIREQAALPPVPFIRIYGGDEWGTMVDFDVWVNMVRYLLPDSSDGGRGGGGWNYVKIAGENKGNRKNQTPSLEEWVRRYCAEKSAVKSFTLTRQIPNWNTTYVEDKIRSLVASTGYTGRVTITFPIHNARINIQPPRNGVEGVFTTVFGPLMEKRAFEVVTAVWPYASLPAGTMGRVCAVMEEEGWWESWRGVVKMGVVGRRRGIVSVDDLLGVKMGVVIPRSGH